MDKTKSDLKTSTFERNKTHVKNSTILIYILLILGLVIVVMPMVYMVSTSLKPNGALYEFPPKFFPEKSEITLENYKYVIGEGKFYINFINSLFVSVITVFLSAIVSAALAFCVARFDFKGVKLLFTAIMLTMLIPGTTLIIPQYELAVRLNTINKVSGLIPFYVAWVIPTSTFMLKGFIEGIPKELDEAAYIDGASTFDVFFKVILPLIKPGIATVAIFNFLTSWEEFPWANTVINDNMKRTLPIAISGFFGQHQFTQWGYVFALSTLSLIPVLLVFIIFQKYFISDITAGAIKG